MPTTDALFAHVEPAVIEAARFVTFLVLDVDGVLTDGGLYYDAEGRVTKRFDVQDGFGIGLLRKNGIRVAVITGQDSPAVAERMRILHIEDYYAGCVDKIHSLAEVIARHGFAREQTAYLGDDWIDIPAMRRVGFPMAVANAQPEVKVCARYVTRAHGGRGAVREAARLILYARGLLQQLAVQWMNGSSE